MTKYEYKTVYVNRRETDLVAVLNVHGPQGWRHVESVVSDDPFVMVVLLERVTA